MNELENLLKMKQDDWIQACKEIDQLKSRIETLETEKVVLREALEKIADNKKSLATKALDWHGKALCLAIETLSSTTPSALLEVVKAAEDLCTPPDTTGLGYYGLSEVIDEHRNEGMKKLKAAIDAYKASGEK